MPIHNWTRVDPGIFHHFHHGWIYEIKQRLNRGLLPPERYAIIERITRSRGPDVLVLPNPLVTSLGVDEPRGAIAVAEVPPRVRFHATSEPARYAETANAIVIRHSGNHRVIAIVEIVSPGNKNSPRTFDAFVRRAGKALAAGVHLLIVDLLPPGSRDPQGIHRAIWAECDEEEEIAIPPDKPLTCASYIGGPTREGFVEPVAVGDTLPEMPLFLTPDVYVPVPLETTYTCAWDAVPAVWREVLTGQNGQ